MSSPMVYLQKEWKTLIHSKSFGLLLFALLTFLLLFGFMTVSGKVEQDAGNASVTSEPPFALGLIDKEQDAYTELLLQYFEGNAVFSEYVSLKQGTDEEIRALFEEGNLDGYLQIPPEFVQSLIDINHIPLQIVLSKADTAKAVLMQNLFQSYGAYVTAVETGCMTLYLQMQQSGSNPEELERANWSISMELIMAALGRSDFFCYQEYQGSEAVPTWYYYVIAWLSLFPFLFVIPAGLRMIEERNIGIFDRIRLTKNSLILSFLAKLAVIWFAAIWLVLSFGYMLRILLLCQWDGISFRSAVISAIPSGTDFLRIFLFILSEIVLGWLIAFFCTNKREYLLFSGLILCVLAIISGTFLPVHFLPDGMAHLAEWMPNRMLAKIWMQR